MEECRTCIMEARLSRLESQYDKLITDKPAESERIKGLETKVDLILENQQALNAKLDKALVQMEDDKLAQAANKNTDQAHKWSVFKTTFGKIMIIIATSVITTTIGYIAGKLLK